MRQRAAGLSCGVKVEPDEHRLYAITAHGTKNKLFSAWDKGSLEKCTEFELPVGSDLQGVQQDPDYVYVSARDGKVFLIHKGTLDVVRVLQQGESGIWYMHVDQRCLYTASVDQLIRAYDKGSWDEPRVFRGHQANIQALAGDEDYLYSVATDKVTMVWDKATGDLIWEYRKLYPKGMMGLASTGTHLLITNGHGGLTMVAKGQWCAPPLRRPDIRGTRVVVDETHAFFAAGNDIWVLNLDDLGARRS